MFKNVTPSILLMYPLGGAQNFTFSFLNVCEQASCKLTGNVADIKFQLNITHITFSSCVPR